MLESKEADGERCVRVDLLGGDKLIFAPLVPFSFCLSDSNPSEIPSRYHNVSCSGLGELGGECGVSFSSSPVTEVPCDSPPTQRLFERLFGIKNSLHPSARNGVSIARSSAFMQLLDPITDAGIAKPVCRESSSHDTSSFAHRSYTSTRLAHRTFSTCQIRLAAW